MESLDNLITVSPQIEIQTLSSLAQQGIRYLICHRPDAEEPNQPKFVDIEQAAQTVGIKAYYLPVKGGEFPEQAISETAQILSQAATENKKVHMYCRSGTRSTIIWAAIEAKKGKDLEAIIDSAANAGYGIGQLREFLISYQP